MFLEIKRLGLHGFINYLIKVRGNVIKLNVLDKPVRGKILEVLVIRIKLFFKTVGLSNK